MEQILMSGATGILKKLVGVVSEDIALAWDVKDELKKLQSTSEMILAVIADAEKRQDKEELVRLWLRRLKDVAYDADDVMDEFSYEDMRRRNDSSKHKLISFHSSSNPPLAFRLKMAKRIKEINKRLDEITRDMGRFQLETTAPDGESTEQLDRQNTSHVHESEVVGREYDESQIINLLTANPTSSTPSLANPTTSFLVWAIVVCFLRKIVSFLLNGSGFRVQGSGFSSISTSPEPNQEKVSVISIVGMGGLGKTTLAQLAYKDELVKKVFELTIWVHVSEIFDIETILVNIMESITETKFHTPSNLHVLVDMVQKRLNGKIYLLVLDDLWNEDSEQWGSLMSVLVVGAPGSKVLITTRNDQVASIVRGTIPPYSLKPLQDDACWCIIKQKAFSPGGALNALEMSDIGKEIARKCCGLPIAAKFLGSLMRLKNKKGDWMSIRDDDIWNTPESKRKILPVLKLSYNYLPSHLKQCFSYCSIFPKNWEISKETLVHLWMAEGFLKQSNYTGIKRTTEDFGRDYFESLAWSSFFQDFKKNDLGDIETCKMHDLVHDLARDVLGENELVPLKVSKLRDVSEVRRLRLELDEDISAASLKCLSKAKKLRTLFISEGSKLNPSIFPDKNHLRILYMGRAAIHVYVTLLLPSLSFKLRHLRYLRLTSLNLREVKNDQSIGKLYSLETLILNNMHGVQNLLTKIQSLRKLRYLEVSCSDMAELPDSITSLYNLQTLDLNHCELKVIPDAISGLKNLRFLNLSFNPIQELPLSVLTLSSLETLDVNTCKNLKALPEEVSDLVNLRIFNFKNCPLLEALPGGFGALTQLRSLDLEGTQIKALPESCTNLNNLEYAHLSYCELPKEVTNWTKLREFYYGNRETPSPLGIGRLVFLETLTYKVREAVGDGIEELADLNFLRVLLIQNLQNVTDPTDAARGNLRAKHNLRELYLFWSGMMSTMRWDKKSSNFQVFEALRPPSGLRTLRIINFMGSEFPMWMRVPSGLPSLVKLVLSQCTGIKQLPAAIGQIPHLKRLDLEGVSLKSLDIGGFPSLLQLVLTDMLLLEELHSSHPSCLRDMQISGCRSLSRIPLFPSLTKLILEKIDPKLVSSVGRSLTSLTELCLGNIEDLLHFPMSILQNNCNIRYLKIQECSQLQGFRMNDDNGNGNKVGPDLYGISMQKLVLMQCPVLKFLPDLRGWTSLRQLTIFRCPRVKESLTYDLKSLHFVKELNVDYILVEMLHQLKIDDNLINLLVG